MGGTMLADALRTYYGYTRWANEKILDAAEGLTPAQLHEPGHAGHGSIRDTLAHMLDTHLGWLSWWDGSLPVAQAYGLETDRAELEDVAGLRRLAERVHAQSEAFLATLTDEDAARVLEADLPNGQHVSMILWPMMLHLANHGTQHRSEVAAMLSSYGQSPGDLDLIYYHAFGGASTR